MKYFIIVIQIDFILIVYMLFRPKLLPKFRTTRNL